MSDLNDYIVTVRLDVKAENAKDAENNARAFLGLSPKTVPPSGEREVANITSIEYNGQKLPELSHDMIMLFDAELSNSEESGELCTLDAVDNSLAQMPQEILEELLEIWESNEEGIKETLQEELDALIAKYGAGTCVVDLLPEDDEP